MSGVRCPFEDEWWDTCDFRRRIFDQYMGQNITETDLYHLPSLHRRYHGRQRSAFSSHRFGPSETSEVSDNLSRFRIKIEVRHFAPEEITVKTVGNSVVIHARHEEKPDEHGFIAREFTRRYVLPRDVEPDDVTSSLSSYGVLTVEAVKKVPQSPKRQERIVPVSVEVSSTSSTAASKLDQPGPSSTPSEVKGDSSDV